MQTMGAGLEARWGVCRHLRSQGLDAPVKEPLSLYLALGHCETYMQCAKVVLEFCVTNGKSGVGMLLNCYMSDL
mgnify:CR=1 FL=1